jgi:DNA-binding NtrC family response regulator
MRQRLWLRKLLENGGWRVAEVGTPAELASTGLTAAWELIFCSIHGFDAEAEIYWLNQLRQKVGTMPHIIAVGRASKSVATVAAILCGASDYLAQPLRDDEVRQYLSAWEEQRQANAREVFSKSGFLHPGPAAEPGLIGEARPLVEIIKQMAGILAADRNANSGLLRPASFFLTGETGTGKELFARLLHRRSRFAPGPFVAVNCATLPAELAEAELFGHEAGAFTGAQKARPGLWEQASGGTLFLDEITEAPPALLPKLLRVLEDGQVRRIGSERWRQMRVQVIAASNRNIWQEIAAGRFRRDLHQRFLYQLHLPALRERRSDIPLLARYFVQLYASGPAQFSQEALEFLQEQEWPGNVRELENLLRTVLTQTGTGRITAAALRTHRRESTEVYGETAVVSPAPAERRATASLEQRVKEFKRQTAQETLLRYRGNISQAAAALGLTRPTFYRLLDDG